MHQIKPNQLLKKLTCLYVEDDENIRESFLLMIKRYFKNVIVATNGEEGLSKYLKNKDEIDMIISDIRMPKLTGIEMAKKIKEINEEIIIIFITAFNDIDYLKEAIDLGVDGYITKPIERDKLLKKLNKLAFFIKQKKENESLMILLTEIFNKQINPIVLIKNEEIILKNDAFKRFFRDIKTFKDFTKTINVDFSKNLQIIELQKNSIKVTLEIALQKINNDFILITFTDITQFEEAAMTDELTNLYNRKIINKLFPMLLNHPICVALLDIDDFKKINDTYGHLKGDKVLKVLANILRKTLRKNDTIIRWGGEEFLIIFDSLDSSNIAKNIIEYIRETIEKTEIKEIGHITCSFGVGCQMINNEENFAKLISKVDDALYLAKRKGKNRVEIAH